MIFSIVLALAILQTETANSLPLKTQGLWWMYSEGCSNLSEDELKKYNTMIRDEQGYDHEIQIFGNTLVEKQRFNKPKKFYCEYSNQSIAMPSENKNLMKLKAEYQVGTKGCGPKFNIPEMNIIYEFQYSFGTVKLQNIAAFLKGQTVYEDVETLQFSLANPKDYGFDCDALYNMVFFRGPRTLGGMVDPIAALHDFALNAAKDGNLEQFEKEITKIESIFNTDVRDVNGNTPLILAANSGNKEFVKKLLDLGASPKARNAEGLTAREVAKRAGHTQIAEMLK
jgi:ankyrin repeat protein